jgi:hypothetical protein
MYKSATKCNETIDKWCKNKHGASKIIDTLETYHRARPEGSISKGYGTEEVIESCVVFIPNLKSIGVTESCHEGRLSGKGTLRKKSIYCMDGVSFTQAHCTVLQSSTLVAPYITKHKNIVRSQHLTQSDSWITHKHMATFGGWLRTHLINNNIVGDQLYLLARSPSSTIFTFQGYEINGIHSTRSPKIKKRARTKTMVSALMQQTTTGKRTPIIVT